MGKKQHWTNDQLKCLLDTCIDEVNTIGRKGFSLHKDSWKKLGKVLNERFGLNLTQRQMKNAYDNLKAKYIGWVYLKNRADYVYNSQRNTFNLTYDEWGDFKKKHPRAASLKTIPLPYPELCATLFGGNSANGNMKWTSSQTTSGVGSSSSRHVQTLQILDTPFGDNEDDDSTSYKTDDPYVDPASPIPPPSASSNPPSNDTSPNVGRHGKKAKSSITFDDLLGNMQKVMQHMLKENHGPTAAECFEKLKLVGLSKSDPLFLDAITIFGGSKGMREAWMIMPDDDPELLIRWLKMAATRKGLYK